MIFYNSEESALFGDKRVRFVLTDRFGGKSEESFYSLNLGANTNDRFVDSNKEILKSKLNAKKLHFLNQIHKTDIIKLENSSDEFLGEGDGVFCDSAGLYAMICVADCNPVLLFSKNKNAFIALHAGRAGLEQNIISRACEMLEARDIIAFVGVSIRKCCYEISGELLQKYLGTEFLSQNNGKFYLDMIKIIESQAKDYVQEFEVLEQCSCCDERFFSYRRDKNCGRYALVAWLA